MISGFPSQPFFNLTTPGRVPFVADPATPGELTSTANFNITGGNFLGTGDASHGMRVAFSGKTSLVSSYTSTFSVSSGGIELETGGLSRVGWDANGIAFYNSWAPRFAGGSGQTLLRHLSGAWLVGNDTNQSNGALQLATHTTAAGGVGFFDLALFRSGASRLATNAANFDCVSLNASLNITGAGVVQGFQVVAQDYVHAATGYKRGGVQVVSDRKTGWGSPTGTPTRTAFDTGTVTLSQLAERVKALIDDLHAANGGHGLIGA